MRRKEQITAAAMMIAAGAVALVTAAVLGNWFTTDTRPQRGAIGPGGDTIFWELISVEDAVFEARGRSTPGKRLHILIKDQAGWWQIRTWVEDAIRGLSQQGVDVPRAVAWVYTDSTSVAERDPDQIWEWDGSSYSRTHRRRESPARETSPLGVDRAIRDYAVERSLSWTDMLRDEPLVQSLADSLGVTPEIVRQSLRRWSRLEDIDSMIRIGE